MNETQQPLIRWHGIILLYSKTLKLRGVHKVKVLFKWQYQAFTKRQSIKRQSGSESTRHSNECSGENIPQIKLTVV